MAREHNNTFLTWSSSVGRAIDCRGFHISIGHRFDSGLRDSIYIHLEYICSCSRVVKGDRLKFCCVCFASSNLAASIFIGKNSNTFQYKLKNRYHTHLRITIFSRFSKK